MDQFLDFLSGNAEQLGQSLLVAVVLFVLRYVLLRVVVGRLQDAEVAFRIRRNSFYAAVAVFILSLAWVWTHQLGNVGSFIGLLSAGIAIALSDVLKNLAGWAYITVQRPLRVGDRIEVGPHSGDVMAIHVFRFSLMEIHNWVDADQATGRILHLPNGILFTEPMANYTQGFPYIWLEIPVTVTFESDWEQARDMVQAVIESYAVQPVEDALNDMERAAHQHFVRYHSFAPAVYVKAIDIGVNVTGRLLVPSRGRRGITSRIWSELLPAIDAHPDVALAYPTTRFYRADREGEPPGAGAAEAGSEVHRP